MPTLTFEQELLNSPDFDYRREREKRDRPDFSELMGLLNYNQGLVEFADSKAGSLILLNSLLIAAVAALPAPSTQVSNLSRVGFFFSLLAACTHKAVPLVIRR